MRKMRYLLLAFLILWTGQLMNAATELEDKKVNVKVNSAKQEADSLIIDLDIMTEGKCIKSNNSLTLTPILVMKHTLLELPEVMIKGRRNYKAFQRQLSLMSPTRKALYNESAPYVVIRGYKKSEANNINYRVALPYATWMNGAQLMLKEEDCGCGEAVASEMIVLAEAIEADKVITPYTIQPFVAYIVPEVEIVKKRFVKREAVLDFPLGSAVLMMNRANNRVEMDTIFVTMNSVVQDENVKITGVEISGYASPEGNATANQKLSENRAKALVSVLRNKYPYPESFYSTLYGGEDWAGLVNELKDSDYPYADSIIALINNNANVEQRKEKIRSYANGMPYKEMLITLYPPLRCVVFKANFDVKQFDLEEAKVVIRKNPQHLSLNEMFSVANQYPIGSDSFNEVFFIAADVYPNSPEANINAANAAIKLGDYNKAERYLKQIDTNYSSPYYDNAMGMLLMMKEQKYDEAQTLFERAAQEGINSAKLNINELNKKRNNINEMRGKMP